MHALFNLSTTFSTFYGIFLLPAAPNQTFCTWTDGARGAFEVVLDIYILEDAIVNYCQVPVSGQHRRQCLSCRRIFLDEFCSASAIIQQLNFFSRASGTKSKYHPYNFKHPLKYIPSRPRRWSFSCSWRSYNAQFHLMSSTLSTVASAAATKSQVDRLM